MAEFASACLAYSDQTVVDRTQQLIVFDIQAALMGHLDRRSGLIAFVRAGTTSSVGRWAVGFEVEVGRQFEQAVGGQSAVEEPVVGRSVGQIELGRFVEVALSVESLFVVE